MSIAIDIKKEHTIFFIFLAALLVRVIYILQVIRFPLSEYLIKSNTFDQYFFNNMALSISSGNILGGAKGFLHDPFYSYFLGFIYKFLGYNHLIVYIAQAFLSSLGVIFLYKASKEIFNKTVGLIASFIFAFYSMSIFYDAVLLRASIITAMNIFLFFLIIKAYKKDSLSLWFLGGLVLGLTMVTRHNVLYPFILIFIFSMVKPLKKKMGAGLIFTVGFIAVILPIVIRNYVISDHKDIYISKSRDAFWVGNTYNSSGVDFDKSDEYYYLKNQSKGSVKKMTALFLKELKKRPEAYLKLYLRKLWMFINGYEVPSNTNYYLYREEFPTILKAPFFSFRLISSLAFLGAVLSLFMQRRPLAVYLFLIVLSGSVVMFHIQSRYRLPVVPFFIIFSSYTIWYLFENLKRQHYLKTSLVFAVFIFLYVVIRPDVTYGGFRDEDKKIRDIDRTNLALAYLDSYKESKSSALIELAIGQCDIAIRNNSASFIPYAVKAQAYLRSGRYDRAINQYKYAIIYDNRNPFLHNDMAGVYFFKGSSKEARLYMGRAVRLFPGNKVFEENLAIMKGALSHGNN